MQLLQARRLNGHKISDSVVFRVATNDTKLTTRFAGLHRAREVPVRCDPGGADFRGRLAPMRAHPSHFFWPLSEELKVTALAALKSIAFDKECFVPCARCAMSVPPEAVVPAKRADDRLATSLKLTRSECLFECGFNPALNCCDGFVHTHVVVAER
jgi:hypothetical protein